MLLLQVLMVHNLHIPANPISQSSCSHEQPIVLPVSAHDSAYKHVSVNSPE